jgi:hypothetical protein
MRAILIVSILLTLTAGPVYADCTEPADNITIPNGITATRAQMDAASKAVNAYAVAMQAYADCLKRDLDANVPAAGDRGKLFRAVDDSQSKIDIFNQALHDFNAQGSGNKNAGGS